MAAGSEVVAVHRPAQAHPVRLNQQPPPLQELQVVLATPVKVIWSIWTKVGMGFQAAAALGLVVLGAIKPGLQWQDTHTGM